MVGRLGLLGELQGRQRRGAGGDHPAAEVEHRRSASLIICASSTAARSSCGGRIGDRRAGNRDRDELVLHVLRHVDQHRARAAGHGDAKASGTTSSRSLRRTHEEVVVIGTVMP